ncbi:MAG: hypothetical protein CME21_20940 [Gemmatimonadetes bacterium]|nr:hypothetical protein [Gemmatimonadota bacterium]
MLSELYPPDRLRDILVLRDVWHPYPTRDERDPWEAIPDGVRKAHVLKGEACIGYQWEPFRATLFLEMAHTGKRAIYDKHRARHRTALCDLVMAECLEAEGRFLDDIVDGVWALCEESFWGKPFTLSNQKAGFDLPDTSEPIVALFVAEAASLLSWTVYLLGPQIDSYSTLILPRIEREMERRVLTPCLEREDFTWMGLKNPARRVNNWNPWIISNWLTAALLQEPDPDRRTAAVAKSIRCLDNFIDPYPRDGGCDEGPGYWERAGASLYECLETLHSATNGEIDVWDDPLIRNIGTYIKGVQIDDRYFVNFADAHGLLTPSPSLVYHFGKRIGDPEMMAMGAHFAEGTSVAVKGFSETIARLLPAMLSARDLIEANASQALPRDTWLPYIQVVTARDKAGSPSGFFVAAKGGHNDESHNHNDVGHVSIYIDGQPLIVDAGVETYTGKTFSPNRYEIWTMQSAYHTLPTIDGVMQAPGPEYAAGPSTCEISDQEMVFATDISGAYPEDANLDSYVRKVTLVRGKEVLIEDFYELTKVTNEITLSLLTPCGVAIGDGVIQLSARDIAKDRTTANGQIIFEAAKLTPSIETIELEDSRVRSVWGERLYRIILTLTSPGERGNNTVRFTRGV